MGTKFLLCQNALGIWCLELEARGILAKFNVRTRALNNTLYWTAQIIGAYLFGYALDFKGLRRTVRAKVALVFSL